MGELIEFGSRRKPSEAETPAGPEMLDMWDSWLLDLEQRDLSTETIRLYRITLRDCSAWLAANGHPTQLDALQRDPDHIKAFLVAWRKRSSAGRADQHRRNLSVFFNWLVREEEIPAPSPMDRVSKIRSAKVARPLYTDEEVKALLAACQGNDFEARRDTAIIRIFIDNGMRVGGMASLRYHRDDPKLTDVFLKLHYLRIRLKGGDEFLAPIGKKSAAAIDRYIRVRNRLRHADSPYLWLPSRRRATANGDVRLTASGIYQMIERRAVQAGVRNAHPHRFRRTSTHLLLAAGADLTEAMRIGGWKTLAMPRLYAEELEDERAREAHARVSPGDRF